MKLMQVWVAGVMMVSAGIWIPTLKATFMQELSLFLLVWIVFVLLVEGKQWR